MPCCPPWPLRQPTAEDEEVLHSGELFLRSWNGHVEAWQHVQSARLGSARGQLLRLLRARLAALSAPGGSDRLDAPRQRGRHSALPATALGARASRYRIR